MQNYSLSQCRKIGTVIACCFAISLIANCSQAMLPHVKYRSEFELIEKYYRQGQYQKSLEQCAAFISAYRESPLYDRALFYAALNNLHLNPPEKSHDTAIQYFNKLLSECPESSLRDASAAWVSVLTASDRSIALLKKELDEKQVQITKASAAKDHEIVKLKAEIEKLKKEIELLKKVDLQYQQSKRNAIDAGKSGSR